MPGPERRRPSYVRRFQEGSKRAINRLHRKSEPPWATPPANRIRETLGVSGVRGRNVSKTADRSVGQQEVFHWYPNEYAKRKDWILTTADIIEVLQRGHQETEQFADRGGRVSAEESIMKLFADIEDVKDCTFRKQTYEKKNTWPFELAGVSFELKFKRKKPRFIQDRDTNKEATRITNSLRAKIIDSAGEKVTAKPFPRKEILIVNLTDDSSMRLAVMTAISLGLSDKQDMYTTRKGWLRAVVWADNSETFRTVQWKRNKPAVESFQYNKLAS